MVHPEQKNAGWVRNMVANIKNTFDWLLNFVSETVEELFMFKESSCPSEREIVLVCFNASIQVDF